MENYAFAEGSRVRVISYSPFRGLKGTIRSVHRIAPLEEPFCFYQIALEGAQIKEPIWFAYEEVEVDLPARAHRRPEFRRLNPFARFQRLLHATP